MMFKRLLVLFFAFIFLLSACPPVFVYAYTDPDTGDDYLSNYEQVRLMGMYLLWKSGAIIAGDAAAIQNNQSFIDWCNNVMANEGEEYYYADMGENDFGYPLRQLVITDKAMDELYMASVGDGNATGLICDCSDFYYANTFTPSYFVDKISNMSGNVYQSFMRYVNENSVFQFFSLPAAGGFSVYRLNSNFSDSDLFFVPSYTDSDGSVRLYFYNSDGDLIDGDVFTRYIIAGSNGVLSTSVVSGVSCYSYNSVYRVSNNNLFNRASGIITSDGRQVKIWKSAQALRLYLRGLSFTNTYVSDSFNDYNVVNDNSVRVNNQTLNNIFNNNQNFINDTKNTVNNITTAINGYYIDNGTTMSQQEVNNLINVEINNIINKYEVSVPEPTPVPSTAPVPSGSPVPGVSPSPSGSPLPSVSPLPYPSVSPGADAFYDDDGVSWLQKIYFKLCDILDSIKDLLHLDAAVGIADIIKDLFAGGADVVDEFKDDVVDTFADVTEMLPEKFPTCIPWDLIAIFAVMVSDPSPPVYEIPFNVPSLGINETLTLDLSIMEPVAKVSRTMLSLIFVLFLINMTLKLTGGINGIGGDD